MNVFIFSLSNIRIFFAFIYNKILFYNNSFNLIEFKNILFKFLEGKLKQTILTFDFPEKIQTIFPEYSSIAIYLYAETSGRICIGQLEIRFN